MKILLKILLALVVLLAVAIAGLYFIRPGMDQYRAHAWPQQTPSPGVLTASWYGTDALLLSDGTHAVMVDPFFTRPNGLLNMATNASFSPDEKLIEEWLKRAGVTRLDAVMVTHSHFDHSMDAGIVARMTGAVLLGSESTANVGRGTGLAEAQIRVVKPGEVVQAGSFKLTFIESRHAGATGGAPTGTIDAPLKPPAHYLDYKLGTPWSILVEHPQGSILVHGSAGFVPGALKGYHADIAFIGVSIVDDLESYLRETVQAVGAKRVVPMHWDDFTRPLDQPLVPLPLAANLPKFFKGMQAHPELQVLTLDVGQKVAVIPTGQ